MQLTSLEIVLGGSLVSLVTTLAVRVWIKGHYVSRKECQLHHERMQALNRDVKLVFAMLRGIVVHMDGLTPEQREKILNMKVSSGKE